MHPVHGVASTWFIVSKAAETGIPSRLLFGLLKRVLKLPCLAILVLAVFCKRFLIRTQQQLINILQCQVMDYCQHQDAGRRDFGRQIPTVRSLEQEANTEPPLLIFSWVKEKKKGLVNVKFGMKLCQCVWFFKVLRIQKYLRTVPTIVIAHTFCASPDTRISYRWCSLIQGYFCAV